MWLRTVLTKDDGLCILTKDDGLCIFSGVLEMMASFSILAVEVGTQTSVYIRTNRPRCSLCHIYDRRHGRRGFIHTHDILMGISLI